jgi:tetratricopeptide (TPR) repeat protein
MSKIEILSCSSCGASLSPKVMKCDFCDSINVVTKNTSPFKLNAILSKQYLNSGQLSTDKVNTALLHLNLKNYEIAKKLLELEIEINPINADAYFYYAICLINGKRIKSLTYSDIKKISQYINSAIQIKDDAKYYFLSAIINYDFFEGNGMLLPDPNYYILLEKFTELKLGDDDLEFLENHIIIPQNELFNQFTNK